MASLMDRVRQWLGVEAGHTEEHEDIRTELTEQKTRIRALDAYLEARVPRKERRHTMTASHPRRRVSDL